MRITLLPLAMIASALTLGNAPAHPGEPLATLDTIVGANRTVVFGEDSHGMAAVHRIVPTMFERLVKRKGFRVFVFEVQWNVTDAFRDFMASDRTTLNTQEQYYLDGAFVSDDVAAMLVWIRTWNRAHPRDLVSIYGYQPEQPVTDSRALVNFLRKDAGGDADALITGLASCKALDPGYTSDLDMTIANGKLSKAGKPSFSEPERAFCLSAVDRVQAYLKRNDARLGRHATRTERVLAHLHAVSLHAYVDVLRRVVDDYIVRPDQPIDAQRRAQHRIYNDGDGARFEVLRGLKGQYFADKKVFYWMHNWHAARHASEIGSLPDEAGIPAGTISIGERIAAQAPRSTVVIGNIVPCGTTCNEPAGSLEPAFAAKYGDQAALVDLRVKRDTSGLPVRQSGVLYANQNKLGFGDVTLSRQFDAILYIPKTDHVH